MQTVEDFLKEARQGLSNYAYYVRYEIVSRGAQYGKIRLIINRDLFVQANRNEAASLTNFALIHRSQRIYGRDEYRGVGIDTICRPLNIITAVQQEMDPIPFNLFPGR